MCKILKHRCVLERLYKFWWCWGQIDSSVSMHFAKKKKNSKESEKNKKQKAFIVARQRLKFETSLLKIEDLLHYEFKCQKFCKIIFWGVCFLDLNY